MKVSELEILYIDDHLVAAAKPSGLLVHRSGMATDRITCMTIVRDQLGRWVWPVHRLDRGTSGVLLFALDPAIARDLGELFRERGMTKEYLAVTRGWLEGEQHLDYPLAEEPGDLPQEAITRFEGIARTELPGAVGRYPTARYGLVRAMPESGRRHQIRRHLAHLRHPVIGDTVHGEGRHNRLFRERFGIGRLLLHAARIAFRHPVSGDAIAIDAPLPAELVLLFDELGWSEGVAGRV